MRLLDLFSGAGGCSVGYARAGFVEVVGVDNAPMPRYPFAFVQADALEYLEAHGHEFDAIHASPPCQAYSSSTLYLRNRGREYPDLMAATRALLEATGRPWVMENVWGSPMRPDVELCGCMFGLRVRRRRWFELSWAGFLLTPPHDHGEVALSVVGNGTPSWVRQQLGYNPTAAEYRAAMGIDWMDRVTLSQAIPPAYTEFIGAALLEHLAASTAA